MKKIGYLLMSVTFMGFFAITSCKGTSEKKVDDSANEVEVVEEEVVEEADSTVAVDTNAVDTNAVEAVEAEEENTMGE